MQKISLMMGISVLIAVLLLASQPMGTLSQVQGQAAPQDLTTFVESSQIGKTSLAPDEGGGTVGKVHVDFNYTGVFLPLDDACLIEPSISGFIVDTLAGDKRSLGVRVFIGDTLPGDGSGFGQYLPIESFNIGSFDATFSEKGGFGFIFVKSGMNRVGFTVQIHAGNSTISSFFPENFVGTGLNSFQSKFTCEANPSPAFGSFDVTLRDASIPIIQERVNCNIFKTDYITGGGFKLQGAVDPSLSITTTMNHPSSGRAGFNGTGVVTVFDPKSPEGWFVQLMGDGLGELGDGLGELTVTAVCQEKD